MKWIISTIIEANVSKRARAAFAVSIMFNIYYLYRITT